MDNSFFAVLAEFFHFQSRFDRFFIFLRVIVDAFAVSALQFYHVVLRHMVGK